VAYGDLSFLYLRTREHERLPMKHMRYFIHPPIDLRFYQIFHIAGVPRFAITWAFLSPEAEGSTGPSSH